MNFALSRSALACLKAQTNLTGQFTQVLHDDATGARIKSTLQTLSLIHI